MSINGVDENAQLRDIYKAQEPFIREYMEKLKATYKLDTLNSRKLGFLTNMK